MSLNRPFLKWAGGKFRVLPHLLDLLPKGDRLIEPFLGSGAVFLNAEYDRYLLADINPDLIGLYQTLKRERHAFVDHARSLFIAKNNTEYRYYQLREQFNAAAPGVERYALFLYLNRHGFNGLCRYNGSGQFNVPFGRYKAPYFPAGELRHFIKISARAKFVCADFRAVLKKAGAGDVVYCDPPYVPLTRTANFTAYAGNAFSDADQVALALAATKLGAKGVPVVVSNHDTASSRVLYSGATAVQSFSVQRSISAIGARRLAVPELLASYASI